MPITPSCQLASHSTYPRRARCSGVQASTWATAARRMRLHSLPLTVEPELRRNRARLRPVHREQQLEREVRATQPPRRVDARREPERDRAGVDSRRIDASGLHQRLQPRPARSRERAQACRGEGAVLVDERHDVRDRRQGDEIERPRDGRVVVAEEGARERVDDARAAQVGARVRRGPRRDDGTFRQRRGRPMVVGDDHVETELTRARDLLHRGDPAVDRQHEVDAVLGEALDQFRREPATSSKRLGRRHSTFAPSSRRTSTATAVAEIPSTS